MNKLITSGNGGFPYKLDDLRFEQEAVRNAFLGFITGFGITAAESFIISGCEVTGDDIAEGYICLEGEICKVDAHTMPTPGGGEVRYFELAISYDPAGFKQFENSTTAETYQVRKATILAGVGTGKFLLTGAKNIHNKIIEKSLAQQMDWEIIPSLAEYPSGTSGTTGFYMKDNCGFVHLRGTWGNEDPGEGMVVGTLPVGFRPEVQMDFRVKHLEWNGSSNDVRNRGYVIETNGQIKTYSNGQYWYFENIPPFKAV